MEKKWWHDKVAYQIYPKSFMDTNGDGIGDIRGIINKLDYLKDLGIDIIWISPIYQSPLVDQGYDISDYYKIDERFGTMEDFEELIAEAKKRNIGILMDLVINHCSDQHVWFKKALQDVEGEYGDYFYFRKGKNGQPPCNYRSYFGGSAWEKVQGTDYYYLHLFAKEQPDLNWYNPKVKEELYSMINWWLDKGLAGFRIDAIINIRKDLQFKSLPADGDDGFVHAGVAAEKVPGIGDMLEDLKKNTFEKHDAFTVAEVFNMRKDELREFIGDNGHFSTMFDFSAECLAFGGHGWYDAPEITFEDYRRVIFHSQRECEDVGFMANIIENHDEPRGASRYIPSYAQNETGKKMLATVNRLLRGIPFIYQGQEIGMTNCPMKGIEEYDDISTVNQYNMAVQAGVSKELALKGCYEHSRDNARTPMQWSDEKNAGFTNGKPWLKVNPNYKDINVSDQENREDSLLNYYKKLIALRKSDEYRELLTYGITEPIFENEDKIFAYKRVNENGEIVVLANFGKQDKVLELENRKYRVILNNMEDLDMEDGKVKLKSCQSVVLM